MAYTREDIYDGRTTEEIAAHYREILRLLGEDPDREGLLKTPERVAKALQFLTKGYGQDGTEILSGALFKEDYSQMVLVKDIELYSTCEHHLMPFIGKAHVAYIPDGTITGLAHGADTGLHSEDPQSHGSCGGHRGGPYMHADKRGRKGQCDNRNFCIFRSVPERRTDQK